MLILFNFWSFHNNTVLLYLKSQRSSKLWEPGCFIPIEITKGQCNRCPVANFIQNYPAVGAEWARHNAGREDQGVVFCTRDSSLVGSRIKLGSLLYSMGRSLFNQGMPTHCSSPTYSDGGLSQDALTDVWGRPSRVSNPHKYTASFSSFLLCGSFSLPLVLSKSTITKNRRGKCAMRL